MNKWIKPLGLLFLIVFVCSIMVRVLSGSETLDEYAIKNPELAYATPEKQWEENVSPTATPSFTPSPAPSPTPSAASLTVPEVETADSVL